MFDVWNLVAIIFIVYGLFSLFQSSTGKGKAISGIVILLALAFLGYRYSSLNGSVPVDAPIFQQFQPILCGCFNSCFHGYFRGIIQKRQRTVGTA